MALIFDTWEDFSFPRLGVDDVFHAQFLDVGFPPQSDIHTNDLQGDRTFSAIGFDAEVSEPTPSPLGGEVLGGLIDHSIMIATSAAGDPGPVVDDDIVVVGERNYRFALPDSWFTGGGIGGGEWLEGGAGGGGGTGDGTGGADPAPTSPDEAYIEVDVNFDRPLTASEQKAIDNLKASIEKITTAIMSLADDAMVKLPNGADVTGAELKAIWAKTDFIINDNVIYDNGTRGGEAKMSNGEPTISFNIQYLNRYDDADLPGGMNYLVAHELGHLSQAGTSFYTDQRTANDIARALLNGAGLAYLANPGFGYTATAPMLFSAPPPPSGDDGSDPGGGGGGWEDDQPL